MQDDFKPPAVVVQTTPPDTAPVRQIDPEVMRRVAAELLGRFEDFKRDRQVLEQQWLRNLRQYRGIYDPEDRKKIPQDRSLAYPRITRVKCLSIQARLMNLMFPGNEKNWELTASPSADISPQEVMQAIQQLQQADQDAGVEPRPLDRETVRIAVQKVADERAREMELEIEDQLQEIGGDQTTDYISMVRQVVRSGVIYGVGVLEGPFAVEASVVTWDMGPDGQPQVQEQSTFKPRFEVLPVWDFYPDLSAPSFGAMGAYFTRKVLPKSAFKDLRKIEGYIPSAIDYCLRYNPDGNYKALSYEADLRSMGATEEIANVRNGRDRFEVICYNGRLTGEDLRKMGAEVADADLVEDLDAVIWLCGDKVIRADINPWRKLGKSVRMVHTFVLDADDTGLIGESTPSVVRDSQLAVSAAARMLLDNASVVCGPQLEVNRDLLALDTDVTAVHAYKIWIRDNTSGDNQTPAVRNVVIPSHMTELLQIIELFMRFADLETFVGPAAGGDQQRGYAEPMRTAAGASMLRADAALPFKDIVRNFDSFTQSLILSLVEFNRAFNPKLRDGDINVVARGATSLIAKEVRGMQLDQMAATLSPEDRIQIDERKFIEQRLAVRDLQGLLVSPDEADRRKNANAARMQASEEQQKQMMQAQIRKVLADAFKAVSQAKKNDAAADASAIQTALEVLERGLTYVGQPQIGEDGSPAIPTASSAPRSGGASVP